METPAYIIKLKSRNIIVLPTLFFLNKNKEIKFPPATISAINEIYDKTEIQILMEVKILDKKAVLKIKSLLEKIEIELEDDNVADVILILKTFNRDIAVDIMEEINNHYKVELFNL